MVRSQVSLTEGGHGRPRERSPHVRLRTPPSDRRGRGVDRGIVPTGLEAAHPLKDLKLNDLDMMDAYTAYQRRLEQLNAGFHCARCPDLATHVRVCARQRSLPCYVSVFVRDS